MAASPNIASTNDSCAVPRTISAGERVYELVKKSVWRSELELRSGDRAVGSIRRAKGARLKLLCDLPGDLPPATQAFIGFVVLTIWSRRAAEAGAAGS